jgi:hypothetical protein
MKMDISILLSVLGMLLTSGIAIWQHLEARKAKRELNGFLESLPSQVFNNVSRLLESNRESNPELYGMMVVQYPIGAHNTALQVFGFRDYEFKLIGETSTDTPAGFRIEDINNDGKVEIIAHEVSLDADLPYVMGFRDEVWYRFENDDFTEIKRINLYEKKELKNARHKPEKWLED